MTTTPPSAPATTPSTTDPRALRLVSVLPGALPLELGTPAEPARYTVPAVFSRQATPQERAHIEDPATARALVAVTGAGPELELTISDRRLLIGGTTLAQLRDGLAAALGEMLARMGQELLAEEDRRSAAAGVREAGERERLEAVTRAAAEIHFGPAAPAVAVPGGAA